MALPAVPAPQESPGHAPGADGATAPETLRQKDCGAAVNLESSTQQVLTEGERQWSGTA